MFGKQELIAQIGELERLGFLRVDWREFRQDVKQIHFPMEKMDSLCEFAGEENPKIQLQKVREVISYWRKDAVRGQEGPDCAWKKAYYDYLWGMTERGNIPSQAQDENLFLCLNRLPGQKRDSWKRTFSAEILKNSKLFELKYERRILTILREYSPFVLPEMEDDEVLAEHGILTYSQRLKWKGPLVYELEGCRIDTKDMIYGTVINAQTLEHGVPLNAGNVKKIITIENKANYEAAAFARDTIFIFSHGFFSPKERRFLGKLRMMLDSQTEYYHWGDMDYGGIRIFNYVKRSIFPEVRPLYMDRENYELALEAGVGIPLKESKREKLEKIDAGDLDELKRLILENDMEIEQETLCTRLM